jgi:RimJ/RimL family protein N-acetyltransferase
MTFDILKLRDTDYEAAALFVGSVDLTQSPQAEDWRQADHALSSSGIPPYRWVAVDTATQTIIGYSHIWPVRFPQFRMDLLVSPTWRRQGVGHGLFTCILDGLHANSAATVQARAREDMSEALAFLHRRQFREIHRMVELRLDLTQIDSTAFASARERLATQSIEVVTLANEQATDPECWQKLTAVHNAALPDWPQPDPGPIDYITPKALQQLLAGWNVIPEAFFLAKQEQQYIGYSGLAYHPTDSQITESGGTAIHPEYRNRGLATNLKMCALSYARQHDYTTAATRSANPAMIRVNEKVGFQRGLSEVRFVRVLAGI